MNVAIAFHSRTGTTKKVAEIIEKELKKRGHKVTLITLIAQHEKGFLGSGYSAFREKEPELVSCDLSAKGKSLLILGTPIWAGRSAPHLLRFLNQAEGLEGKNIALFYTSGGGPNLQGSKKIAEQIQNRLTPRKAKLIGAPLGIRQKELEDPATIQKIKDFVDMILKE